MRPCLSNFQFSTAASLISPRVVTSAACIIEFVLIAALGYALFISYIDAATTLPRHVGHFLYIGATVATTAGSVLLLQAVQLYDISVLFNVFCNLWRIVTAWIIIFAALLATMFFNKLEHEFSRVGAASWHISGLTAADWAAVPGALRRQALVRTIRSSLDGRVWLAGELLLKTFSFRNVSRSFSGERRS